MEQIHLSRKNISELDGSGSPLGVLVPNFIGEFYRDTTATPNHLWIAVGISNAEWVLVSPEEVSESVNYYVNLNASPGGDGSVSNPFQYPIDAKTAVIGSGTAFAPEIVNATIHVASSEYNIAAENWFIEGTIWEFSKGFKVTHTGLGYLFDNTGATASNSICTITGFIEYLTTVNSSGLAFSEAKDAVAGAGIDRQIDITLLSARNENNSGVAAIPLLSSSIETGGPETGYNSGRVSLKITGVDGGSVSSLHRTSILYCGPGSVVTSKDAGYGGIFSSTSASSRRQAGQSTIHFDDNYYSFFDGGIVNGGIEQDTMKAGGTTQAIIFSGTAFGMSGSSNPSYRPDNMMKLLTGFNLDNINGNGAAISEIKFDKCYATSTNFNTESGAVALGNIAPASQFIYTQDLSPFVVNFKDCNLAGKYPANMTFGFYVNNALQSEFVSNVLGYDTGIRVGTTSVNTEIAQTLVYGNTPTSSAQLPSGAIWSNSGVLNIV